MSDSYCQICCTACKITALGCNGLCHNRMSNQSHSSRKPYFCFDLFLNIWILISSGRSLLDASSWSGLKDEVLFLMMGTENLFHILFNAHLYISAAYDMLQVAWVQSLPMLSHQTSPRVNSSRSLPTRWVHCQEWVSVSSVRMQQARSYIWDWLQLVMAIPHLLPRTLWDQIHASWSSSAQLHSTALMPCIRIS